MLQLLRLQTHRITTKVAPMLQKDWGLHRKFLRGRHQISGREIKHRAIQEAEAKNQTAVDLVVKATTHPRIRQELLIRIKTESNLTLPHTKVDQTTPWDRSLNLLLFPPSQVPLSTKL